MALLFLLVLKKLLWSSINLHVKCKAGKCPGGTIAGLLARNVYHFSFTHYCQSIQGAISIYSWVWFHQCLVSWLTPLLTTGTGWFEAICSKLLNVLLELARKTRHRHNKSGIILSVGLVRCVTGESPYYLMPVMMVLRHSSNLFWEHCFLALNKLSGWIWINCS